MLAMNSAVKCPICASEHVERIFPTSFAKKNGIKKSNVNVKEKQTAFNRNQGIVQDITMIGGGSGTGIKVEKNAYLKGKNIKITNMGVGIDQEKDSDISIDGLDIS